MRHIVTSDRGHAVRCPICHQVITSEPVGDGAWVDRDPCRHMLAWHNSGLGELCYTKSEKVKALLAKQIDADGNSLDGRDAMLALYGKDRGVIVVEFDNGYLGGCLFSIDLIVFKKA